MKFIRLSTKKLKIFVINNHHDSPERIAFGSRLINLSGGELFKSSLALAPGLSDEIKILQVE